MINCIQLIKTVFGLKDSSGAQIDPATSTKQSDGTQKSQIVDSGDANEEVDVQTITDEDTNIDGLSGIVGAVCLMARASATVVKAVTMDITTHVLCFISYAHCEIHKGNHFFIRRFTDVANGEDIDYLFVVPDTTKWPHLTISVNNQVEAEFTLYKTTITSDNGTAIAAVNRNQNSDNAATTLVYHTPTITDVGTQIASSRFGSGRSFGGSERDSEELILKQNTKYLLRCSNETPGATNLINVLFDWYEHTNKT